MKLVYTGPSLEVVVDAFDVEASRSYAFVARRLEAVDVDAKVKVRVNTIDPDPDDPAQAGREPEPVDVRLVDALLEQGVWFEPNADEVKAATKDAKAAAPAAAEVTE